MIHHLPALASTLAQMQLQQLQARLFRRLRYRFLYPWSAHKLFPFTQQSSTDNLPAKIGFSEFDAARQDNLTELLGRADAVSAGRFTFLNLPPVQTAGRVDWGFAVDNDPLWLFTLHYWEWSLDLAHAFLLTHQTRYRDSLIGLLEDWITHNPISSGAGWHPYPISRRLVVWSRLHLALADDLVWQKTWFRSIAPSINQQANFLAANLERDLLNNHLISNYRALAWLGLLFPRWRAASCWRQIGLSGLWEEMRRQVLADGVHFERSISYHTAVLQDLLETWWLFEQVPAENDIKVPPDIRPTLLAMIQFLTDTQGSDGSWPMINDSVPGYPIDPGVVLAVGNALLDGQQNLPNQGRTPYFAWFNGHTAQTNENKVDAIKHQGAAVYAEAGQVILRDTNDNMLFFDAGLMGPRHTPGHGHADALSIVLYNKSRPLIVDPGVYSYHDSDWRNYFRSTRVHNTITVDDEDQCLFWGPFRATYLPSVQLGHWSDQHASGQHDGYCRLGEPVIHRRSIAFRQPGSIEITDTLEGSGKHDFTLVLQFALGSRASVDGLNGFASWSDGSNVKVSALSVLDAAKGSIEQGWIATGWNTKQEAPRYVLRWRGTVPLESHIWIEIN